jgi:DNA polymerase-1
VVIVSGDRDLLALCSERVSVALFRGGNANTEMYGPAECLKLMGVEPQQVTELKALAGDQSDGVPGVTGIGPKSAAKILRHYGSLKHAFSDPLLIGVPPPVRTAFREGREQARLGFRLVQLDASIPVGGRWGAVADCFGATSVERVAQLGFAETSRQFQRLPA